MNWNNLWTTVEHGIGGLLLVSIPIFLGGIPATWQNMTIGTALGLGWGIVRNYLTVMSS